MFSAAVSIRSFFHRGVLAVVISPIVVAMPARLAAQKIGPAESAFTVATATGFVRAQLRKIARRDGAAFDHITDNGLLLSGEETRRVLKVRPRDRRVWGRLFRGYSRLSRYQIRGLRVAGSFGPVGARMRKRAGTSKGKPVWKEVQGRMILLTLRIPRKSRVQRCKVFMVAGRYYWEPFGW